MQWLAKSKPASEVQQLITEELDEDSSGDEYVPELEEVRSNKRYTYFSRFVYGLDKLMVLFFLE